MPRFEIYPPKTGPVKTHVTDLKDGQAIRLSSGAIVYRLTQSYALFQPVDGPTSVIPPGSSYGVGVLVEAGTKLTFTVL